MKTGFRLFLVMTILLGGAYSFLITGIAGLLFPAQANGSLIVNHGQVVGSRLIGQTFSRPDYFWSRPSACGYAPASSGSNLSPSSLKMKAQVASASATLPADMVFASGSGLDPHISLAAALDQLDRVAAARGLTPVDRGHLKELVMFHVEPREFGFLGDPRVNVLALNLSIDERFSK